MLTDYFRLVRAPLLFTALADPMAGYCLAAPSTTGAWEQMRILLPLLVASAALYAAGMVFNDCADLVRDRTLHPHRPLASGRIPFSSAFGLGAGLCVVAILAAQRVNLKSAGMAVLISLGILLYNAVTKRHWLGGALTMGALRAGNVLMGLVAAVPPHASLPMPSTLYAAVLFLYVTLLTVLSGLEDPPPRPKLFPWLVGGLVAVVLVSNVVLPGWPKGLMVGLLTGLVGATLVFKGILTDREFDPGLVSDVVKIGVLAIIPLDAAAVVGSGREWLGFLMILLLLGPAIALLSGFIRIPGMEKAT